MPKASTLAKMSDEEYKKLSALELQAFNNDMPETDYAHPYVRQEFPKMLFKKTPDGGVQSATVKNEKEQKALGAGWVESLLHDLGVETAPAAPDIQITNFSIPAPAPKSDAASGT
jgi:hypothetical protein